MSESKNKIVKHVIFAIRSLKEADDAVMADTSYLRPELFDLIAAASVLLEKIGREEALQKANEALHGRP